jgi:hypothetical protein
MQIILKLLHYFQSQYAYIYNCIKQVLKNPYFLKTCEYSYTCSKFNRVNIRVILGVLADKPPPVDPVYEKASISKSTKDTMNSDMNLVSNLEICK